MKKTFFLSILILFGANLFAQNIDESGFCRHYTGTINNIKIRMNLYSYYSITDEKYVAGGNYFYENIGEIINIGGESSKNGAFTLTEYDKAERETAYITGKIEDNKIKGNWQSIDKKKKFDIILTEYYGDSAEFKTFYITQSHYYKNDKEYNPYEMEFFYNNPFKTSENSAIERIQKACAKICLHSSSSNVPDNLKSYFSEKIGDYNTETTEFEDSFEDTDKTNVFYAWGLLGVLKPYFNDFGILSLENSLYEFQGGAHGGITVTYHVFDLKSGKKIAYDQIFKENTDQKLRKIILKKLEIYCSEVKNDSMENLIMDIEVVQPNENFFLTNTGIGFFYNTYEISFFAAGSFVAFIPYSEIKDILRQDSGISVFK